MNPRVRRLAHLLTSPREVRRLLTLRCEGCGHPFRWYRDQRHSLGNRDGLVWHGPCLSLVVMRQQLEDTRAVLGMLLDVTNVTARDLELVNELRTESGTSERSRVFRVLRADRARRQA